MVCKSLSIIVVEYGIRDEKPIDLRVCPLNMTRGINVRGVINDLGLM